VLDLRPPTAWICVPYARAAVLVGRTVPLTMLRTMEDLHLSTECSSVFVQLVLEHRESMEALTFGLVRRRTLGDSRD